MADDVARLVAVMEAQLRGFTKGMEQAQKIADQRFGQIERRMTQTESRFSKGFAAIGTSLTRFLTVAALTAFTRSVINTADRLSDTATQIGITTQQLQELQYAARASGGSAEAVGNALGFLNDQLGAAAKGEGELAEIMRKHKIPMGDAYQVLLDLADATKNAGTQAERTAIATAAFGRAGKENVSFLQQGSAAIKAYADEAHRAGQVWDPAALKRLADLKDSIESLSVAFTNLAAGPMSKALTGLADFLDHLERGTWPDRLQDLASFFSGGLVPHAQIAGEFDKIHDLTAEIIKLDAQVKALPIGRERGSLLNTRNAKAAELADLNNRLLTQPSATPSTTPRTGTPPPPAKAETEAEMMKRIGLPDIGDFDAALKRYGDYWNAVASGQKEFMDRLADPTKSIADTMQWWRQMTGQGQNLLVDMTQQAADLSDILQNLPDSVESTSAALENQIALTDEFRDSVIGLGIAASHGGDAFEDMASRVISRLRDIFVEMAILEPLTKSLFGERGTSGGGIFGGIINGISSAITGGFTGPHASGGTIPAGSWGTANENEAVFASAAGARIVPIGGVSAGRGAASTVHVRVTVQPGKEFDVRVARVASAMDRNVVVQIDRALPGRVAELTADPHRR